jgi:type IV pilus assembly protein PilC
VGQLARALASFLERGVPAQTALRALDPCATGLRSGTLERAARRIEGGARLADALELEQVFPRELVWTLGAAESRRTLPEALRAIADRYERRFAGFAMLVEQVIGPALLIPIGILVGSIVLAIFLPIFKLQQTLGQ